MIKHQWLPWGWAWGLHVVYLYVHTSEFLRWERIGGFSVGNGQNSDTYAALKHNTTDSQGRLSVEHVYIRSSIVKLYMNKEYTHSCTDWYVHVHASLSSVEYIFRVSINRCRTWSAGPVLASPISAYLINNTALTRICSPVKAVLPWLECSQLVRLVCKSRAATP